MPLIAIDASSANKPEKTGVEWYAYRLIEAMKKIPLLDGERVVLWARMPLEGALGTLPAGWSSKVLGWPLKKGWMQGRVTMEVGLTKPDVLFVPSQGLPRLLPKATVTTIHDLGFLRVPDAYDPQVLSKLERTTADAAARATALLTVSDFSRQEISAAYQVPAERIVVTPLAGTWDADVVSDGVSRPYFLFVGRLEKKKNVAGLVRAFDAFKRTRGAMDPFELVLAGAPGYGFDEIEAFVRASPYKNAIRLVGYAETSDLKTLMSEATAFCFPSLYEGFGIPLVDAFASGTPVIAADIPSLREVAGDAALFVPPADVEGWASAMRRVADEPALREELTAKGSARASRFSWDETARLTWEAIRNVLQS
jgi:glycosyltransferase involved in cell wall biosynthesis